MKTLIKAGGLTILLVIPALVFLFLKNFGKNHYTLRTFYPVGFDSLSGSAAQPDTVYHRIPAFSLADQSGRTRSGDDLAGSIYVADFFFTRCPGICPKMSSQLVRVQDAFIDEARVKIVSHTVDPLYDSSGVLEDYAARYGARPEKWFFLTGEKKAIYDMARHGYYVTALEGSGGPEDFIHSEKLVLVDREGHIRGYYDGTNTEDVDRLITEIRILLYEYGSAR